MSQTIEEGGLFVSMNSIRNFRVAWAQTLRRKYVNTCIVDSDGQTLIPEEEISDWLSDLQEFESLGDMQLYSPEHYNQCRIENIQSLKPFENISSADNKCNKNNNNPLSSRATIRNLIKSKTIAGPNEEGVHLYIYVHGFMGSPNDFRVYRNQMKYFHSLLFDEHGYLNNPSLSDQPQSAPLKTDHLLSESNHEKTDKIDIVEMGGNLALEISSFISDNQLKIAKLSFICHSLGGLIARSALAHDIIQRYPLELFVSERGIEGAHPP